MMVRMFKGTRLALHLGTIVGIKDGAAGISGSLTVLANSVEFLPPSFVFGVAMLRIQRDRSHQISVKS
jgi:hypothetical protein